MWICPRSLWVLGDVAADLRTYGPAMSKDNNSRAFRSSVDHPSPYHDLRRRNERRMQVARMLEARRMRQIERAMQAARASALRGPRK